MRVQNGLTAASGPFAVLTVPMPLREDAGFTRDPARPSGALIPLLPNVAVRALDADMPPRPAPGSPAPGSLAQRRLAQRRYRAVADPAFPAVIHHLAVTV